MLNNKIRICRQLYSDIILGLSLKPFMKDLTKSWHLINEWFAFQETINPTLYYGFDECYAIHYTLTPTPLPQGEGLFSQLLVDVINFIALYFQFSIFNFPLSILHSPFSIFHSPLSILHSPLSTLHFPFSIFHFPLSIFHSPFSTFHF